MSAHPKEKKKTRKSEADMELIRNPFVGGTGHPFQEPVVDLMCLLFSWFRINHRFTSNNRVTPSIVRLLVKAATIVEVFTGG